MNFRILHTFPISHFYLKMDLDIKEENYFEQKVNPNDVISFNSNKSRSPAHRVDKTTKIKTARAQQYRLAWEKNPMFSSWLLRGSNNRRARCTVCDTEMSADISVIKYHACCTKHLSQMELKNKNASSYVHEYVPEVSRKGFYNPQWEQDKRYRSWISRGSSETFAMCRLCEMEVPALTSALRRHLTTYNHMKAAGLYSLLIKLYFIS